MLSCLSSMFYLHESHRHSEWTIERDERRSTFFRSGRPLNRPNRVFFFKYSGLRVATCFVDLHEAISRKVIDCSAVLLQSNWCVKWIVGSRLMRNDLVSEDHRCFELTYCLHYQGQKFIALYDLRFWQHWFYEEFWDKMPCSPLKVNRCFGGICRLHFQSWGVSQASNQNEGRDST
jgi:hypothetical protein